MASPKLTWSWPRTISFDQQKHKRFSALFPSPFSPTINPMQRVWGNCTKTLAARYAAQPNEAPAIRAQIQQEKEAKFAELQRGSVFKTMMFGVGGAGLGVIATSILFPTRGSYDFSPLFLAPMGALGGFAVGVVGYGIWSSRKRKAAARRFQDLERLLAVPLSQKMM